jgi:hypothetical protein
VLFQVMSKAWTRRHGSFSISISFCLCKKLWILQMTTVFAVELFFLTVEFHYAWIVKGEKQWKTRGVELWASFSEWSFLF